MKTYPQDMPTVWASYLLNGDASALSPEEAQFAEDWLREIGVDRVLSLDERSARFTNYYRLYGGRAKSGEVGTYTVTYLERLS